MLPAASQLLQSMPVTAAGDILRLLRLTLTAQLKPADIAFAYLGNLAAVSIGEPLLDEEHAQRLETAFEGIQHAHAADKGANCGLTALEKKRKRKDYAFLRQFNEKPSIIPGCPALENLLRMIAVSWRLHIFYAIYVSKADFMM